MEFDELDYFKIEELVAEKRIREPLAYKGKYRDDRARSLLCEIYRQKTGPGS